MSRGRPSENVERKDKWVLDTTDNEGWRTIIKFDRSISPNGPYSHEHIPPKGYRQPKPDIDQRMYGKEPVVMVFKTSNRSNAKTKMKVFRKNIDYVNGAKKLPGVPEKAEILELAVGRSYIDKYKEKYNLS